MAKIYLAGPLFTAGERLHNLFLERALIALGHEVILPQRRALLFGGEEGIDLGAIAKDCRDNCIDPTVIYVGNIDGPDADSGTSVEFGLAKGATGRALIYRTDFRTSEDQEAGVNAMFLLAGVYIYEPCFFTELSQVRKYYQGLAKAISDGIASLR